MQKLSVSWEGEMIYEKLGYLLSSDIGLLDALIILKQDSIVTDFRKGKILSSILKEKNIPQHIISRIIQGEKTGLLDQACKDIAHTLHKEKEIKNKIIISLVYPCILLLVTTAIIVFLVVYIFPKMTPLFTSLKTSLPFTTQTVLFVSSSLIDFWWMYILLVIVIGSLIFFLKEYILYKTPIIKEWYIAQKISQYFSRIGSYIDSGISLDEAVHECASIEQSKLFKPVLQHISTCIFQGISFSYIVEKHYIFPKEISSMILVGENSGKLGNMCKKIGEIYEKKFYDYTKTITTAIEPIAMLIMGFVVGFVALSMITPLYSITQNVR